MVMRPLRCNSAFVFALAVLLPAACVDTTPDKPIDPPAAEALPEADYYADLAAVLEEAVDKTGRVVSDRLKLVAGRLDRQVSIMKAIGPTATPERLPRPEERLAYWLNARAAWALKLSLAAGCHKEISARQLARTFIIDGRSMDLAKIDSLLAQDRDWRTVVAAPGISMQRARMPSEPLTGPTVRQAVTRRFSEFVDDEGRFVIDFAGRRILIPPVVWQWREKLTADYQRVYRTEGATFRTVLLDLLTGSPHRRLQEAVGFACRKAPASDRTCLVKDMPGL